MSINIIELLSKQHGLDKLPKIDPNTQDVAQKEINSTNLLLQAAIPAVLAGFYQFSRNDNDAARILSAGSNSWTESLFGTDKDAVLQKMSAYAGVSEGKAESTMENVASEAIAIFRGNAADGAAVKNLLTAERTSILQHLPAAIDIGKALNDTTLDDRTNKMEGPVSSLMHAIEKKFTSTDVKDEGKF